jgi:hypothetical protein
VSGSPGLRPVAAMLAVAALALFGIGLAADAAHAEPSVIGQARLFDDDGGRGLFDGTVLTPGVPVSRCLRVGADGAPPSRVLLTADDVTGDLARTLSVRIERGATGGFDDCAGFRGATVATGSLSDLAAGPADTAWPAGAAAQTFRITVRSDATSGTARATFVWSALYEQTPAATPGETDPAVAAPAVTSGKSGLAAVLDVLKRLAAQARRHIAIPIAMLAAMGLFLLLQNRFDRKDPKLRLAPVTRSRYVWIPLHGPGRP